MPSTGCDQSICCTLGHVNSISNSVAFHSRRSIYSIAVTILVRTIRDDFYRNSFWHLSVLDLPEKLESGPVSSKDASCHRACEQSAMSVYEMKNSQTKGSYELTRIQSESECKVSGTRAKFHFKILC